MRHITYLTLFLFSSALIYSQVNGLVVNAKTNQPIVGVNITGESSGTSTDELGRFFIDVPEEEELTISHIGYEKVIVAAKDGMEIRLNAIVLKSNEIIVKAGLTEETLQRSTSSVTVFNTISIKQTDGNHFQDVMETIPNLNAAGGTSRPRYFQIRGIGERSHYFSEGPPNFSVGFVLDDIDLSGMGMAGLLYDLEQIEVFKGPQSSIFGPNALAGLISMRSTDPGDAFTAHIKLTGGTDNIQRLNGMVNIPLGNTFAFRVAVESGTGDGFRENKYMNKTNTNGRRENIIREKLLFQPTGNFKAILTAFRAVLDNKYDAWAPDNNKDLFTYTNQQGWDKQETSAFSFRTNYNVHNLNASFITSQSVTDLIHAYDGDWGNNDYWLQEPYRFDPNVTYWNYEFFDSTARNRTNQTIEGRINYGDIVVGYYSKTLEEKDDAIGYLFGGDATLGASEFDFRISAVYGQINLSVSDQFKFLANIRKEGNRINYFGTASNFDWELNDYVPLDTISFDVEHDLWGGKLALQYFVNNDLNIYGSISRGYKAGGVNQHPYLAAKNRPYDPEYMVNYETGLRYYADKSNFHLTLFFANRQNQQVSISSQQQEGDPNSFVYYTANATTGWLSGLEVDGSYQLNSTLTLSGSLGILNTHVDAFTFESDSGMTAILGDRAAAHAPKYSFSTAVDYGKDTGLFGRLEMTGKDKFYYSDSHDEIAEPYQLLNGYFGYNFGDWSIKIWGRNILDTRYTTRGFYFGLEPIWNEELQDHEYPDRKYVSYGDPAHYGLTVDYEFK
ncbi:MAG: TonB-dependent receptor [Fidelibacterota bacterium]